MLAAFDRRKGWSAS
ncbi:hypothetical protein, partial [Frankia casuarinae]